jgi:hypothetical protein
MLGLPETNTIPLVGTIMDILERTPRDWFEEAARRYLETHQGCAWCGGTHCVYHVVERHQESYYCNDCDFHTGYDIPSDEYTSFPGTPTKSGATVTMFEI